MTAAICAFPEDVAPAQALAEALGLRLHLIDIHRFPDGEGLPRAPAGRFDPLLIYCALDRPDPKLMPLLLLADAARRAAAGRLILIAPYMPYLRQDAVFRPGEPVSLQVIGKLLGGAFDTILTLQPHLHRTHSLAAAFHPAKVDALSAAELLAHVIGPDGDPIIVGPDGESAPWVRSIAARLAAPSLVLSKSRSGDRTVEIELADAPALAGRRIVLIDDICSTG
ncbi:MAG TPA: ribose-phosphate diphosphokinase, partial [Caulobacteraceae bacterium]|nr:ribose-phosphate diphosphokinase [Caulobacteraceae bacterium]